jgi:hypothetical protein
MSAEPTVPASEYEAALASDDYKLWKGEEAAPEPAAAEPAEPKSEPVQARQPDVGRVRDPETGKFVKTDLATDDKADKGAPADPEPFEGFSALPPAAQAQFRRLTGERDEFRTRYTRQLGHTRQLAQQVRPGREAPANTAAQARQAASGMAPGAQRQAVQRQIAAWEQHARDFPQDAAAIEQRLAKLGDDVAAGVMGPLQQQFARLQSEIAELRDGYGAIQQERTERISVEHQNELDKIAGDNWRQIAGWEDDQGRPIPREKWDWHPEFKAWIEGHDPDVQDFLWEQLRHPSKVSGLPIAAFNRDLFALDGNASASPTNGHPTPAASVTSRRADNLRDVAPGASRAAKASPTSTWQPTGDPYADNVRAGYEEWKKQMANA